MYGANDSAFDSASVPPPNERPCVDGLIATTTRSIEPNRARVSVKARSTSSITPASASIASAPEISFARRSSESRLRATAATSHPSAAIRVATARPRFLAPKTSSVGMR